MQSVVLRFVSAALVMSVAASCGSASREESTRAGEQGVRDRLVVPAFFFGADANVVGATQSHLVGFTRARQRDDSPPEAAGEMVDLTSGEAVMIEPPRFDGEPFNPLALAANDRIVLLAGQTCPSFWEGEEVCRDSRPASLVFDPATGDWTQHAISVDSDTAVNGLGTEFFSVSTS